MNQNNDIGNEYQDLIRQVEAGRKYRRAFVLALGAAIILAAGIVGMWWRLSMKSTAAEQQSSSGMPNMPASSSEGGSGGTTPAQSETPLNPIQLSPQRMQSIGVQIGTVQSKIVSDELRFYGNVQPNERRLAYVQTRFAGWIREVFVDATGDLVRKGQPLFTIYSPDLVSSEQEYLLAKKNAAALGQSQIGGVASGADSLFASAKGRLQQWDIPASEIEKLDRTGESITNLTINSPVSGYVTEKNALPNMYVQPDTRLYTVADLSEIWVLAQVFQNDAGKIKPGDPAEVTVDTYPGKTFKGRIDYLLPQVDMATRTVPVRLVFPNPGLKLRPGMYVNVHVKLPLGRQSVVPASAIFHSGTRNLIFAYQGEGNIQPREVEVGARVGDDVVITKGVHAGDQIIASANFLIDSEAQLQAAAGAFMPPPPGAGQAAAMNAPAQGNAELTTDPSPPHKGGNTVRVKVTSKDGQPVSGAQVTVTFYMPAMPAMGMAAMKTVVNATDKGGGMYEGSGDLGSGGTWQVTITATQNGQMIANKQLTLNATGGM
jgi:RND family efflux transporter MFP subunit